MKGMKMRRTLFFITQAIALVVMSSLVGSATGTFIPSGGTGTAPSPFAIPRTVRPRQPAQRITTSPDIVVWIRANSMC